MALIALNRAMSMIGRMPRHPFTTPPFVAWKLRQVVRLRDAYEHIEDRALGQVRNRPDPVALTAFDLSLFGERRMRYGSSEIGIDYEATQLCLLLRRHLLRWFRG
jgi:hypothetical protein